MVPRNSIIMMIVVMLGCVLMPIIAYLIVRRKSKNITGAFFAGMLSFFIMQVVIRMPIVTAFLPTQQWYINFATNNYYLAVVIIAFSAALFETVGRYFTMKWILKDKVSYYAGISHGIGHGGIEMIIIIGLAYVSNLVLSLQINSGTFDILVETTRSLGQSGEASVTALLAAKDTLINTPASLYSVALVERFFTLFIHIGLSVMVAEGIARNQTWKYIGFTLLAHTAVDTIVPLMAASGINNWIVEGVLGVMAAAMMYYVLTSKKRFEKLNKVYPVEKEQEMLDADY